MIVIRDSISLQACQPTTWYLVFREKAETWWLNWLPIGRFKHVLAFGYSPGSDTWLFVSVGPARMDVAAVPERLSQSILETVIGSDEVLKMQARGAARIAPVFGFWCVPAVAHLVGLPACALRPDGLWRQCLRHGAERVGHGSTDRSGCSEEDAAAAAASGTPVQD